MSCSVSVMHRSDTWSVCWIALSVGACVYLQQPGRLAVGKLADLASLLDVGHAGEYVLHTAEYFWQGWVMHPFVLTNARMT